MGQGERIPANSRSPFRGWWSSLRFWGFASTIVFCIGRIACAGFYKGRIACVGSPVVVPPNKGFEKGEIYPCTYCGLLSSECFSFKGMVAGYEIGIYVFHRSQLFTKENCFHVPGAVWSDPNMMFWRIAFLILLSRSQASILGESNNWSVSRANNRRAPIIEQFQEKRDLNYWRIPMKNF